MNVILFLTYPIVGATGGTEKVFCNMSNALSDRGHNIIALVFDRNEGRPFFKLRSKVNFLNPGLGFKGNKIIDKIKTIFYINSSDRKQKRLKYRYMRMARLLAPPIVQSNPDIIISFNREATYILKEFVNVKVPVIQMYHFNAEMMLDDDMYHHVMEDCECIQTLLFSDIEKTKQVLNPKKIVTISNVVPQFNDSCDYNCKKIITVGRIDRRQKRTHLLIEAMKLLKSRGDDWKVEIWGDCNYDQVYYNELLGMLRKYELSNIKFMGTSKDVIDKIRGASIFAFPSAYEGFPLALTEAMSMGLPSVGFKNCAAVNELIVNGHNGILCDETVESFAEGLAGLMDDVDKRIEYGRNAKKDMKKYSAEVIWEKWEILIKEVVSENRLSHAKEKK